MKNHSGAAKRFNVTGTGKILFCRPCKRHNLAPNKKSTKQKKALGRKMQVQGAYKQKIATLLGTRSS